MAERSGIAWTHATFNPWIGCQHAGPGCDFCYAEAFDARFGGGHWGPHAPRRRTSAANWREPLKWNRRHAAFFAANGCRRRVFSASLADIFDNAVDPAWRADFWALVRATSNLDYIIVTKRIGNAPEMLPADWLSGAFDHVTLLITVCNQLEADRDIPKLLALPMTARQRRGVSAEPLLGVIDFTGVGADDTGELDALRGLSFCEGRNEPIERPRLDWVIVGGESGPHARPMHPDWARAIRDQCANAHVPFFFKQWGEWKDGSDFMRDAKAVTSDGRIVEPTREALSHADRDYPVRNSTMMRRVGKAKAGDLLDGVKHNAFPEARS